jgi:HEPN domain-containing protein
MLNDARFLLQHGRWHSAVYLAGYAVECKLKSSVCEYLGVDVLPPAFHTHELQVLLRSAGLAEALQREPSLWACFRRIDVTWDVEIRYSGKPYGQLEAEKFLDDVRRLLKWLNTMILH